MKLSETMIVSSSFVMDSKKHKKNPVMNKISYLAFKLGLLRSRTF
ncbi:hypothetical protein PQO01_14330 [Lentisphaera marina]|nr:hypothetical protein [Lentisphaera marina]MDD7986125.1 hypothetical protein [Lentisphaera marina]